MRKKNRKSYKFATQTALYITLFLLVLLCVLLYFSNAFNIWILLGFLVVFYPVSFFIIQYRVERFIYQRVKGIYDDLTLL
ncbi:MAG TPA: hypothetical protein VNJ50_08960, partial [Gelidibacter sp.]|nr:hypothetical protein [Gelidibacter sp.]